VCLYVLVCCGMTDTQCVCVYLPIYFSISDRQRCVCTCCYFAVGQIYFVFVPVPALMLRYVRYTLCVCLYLTVCFFMSDLLCVDWCVCTCQYFALCQIHCVSVYLPGIQIYFCVSVSAGMLRYVR